MKWRQLNEASGKFERDWRERKGKKKDNVEVTIDFWYEVDGRMNGRTNGRTDRLTEGQKEGRSEGRTDD